MDYTALGNEYSERFFRWGRLLTTLKAADSVSISASVHYMVQASRSSPYRPEETFLGSCAAQGCWAIGFVHRICRNQNVEKHTRSVEPLGSMLAAISARPSRSKVHPINVRLAVPEV